jgi:large subunit ribosomal protein LP0
MPAITKKREYAKNLFALLNHYNKALLVKCDSVGSKQFQDIRRAVRGTSVILLGKNTLIKRNIRSYLEEGGSNAMIWSGSLNHLVGNVGIVFTEGDLIDVHKTISSHKVCASARVGVTAPCDVYVPAGSTGMDPSSTSCFQALNIPTKINKGNVEIISSMTVLK